VPGKYEWRGNRFFFFSNEGSPRESCHVHIKKGEKRTKIFLDPEISINYNYGYSTNELANFLAIIKVKEKYFREKWNEYFDC